MDLTTLTLDEFLCTGNNTITSADPSTFLAIKTAISSMLGQKVRNVGPYYILYTLNSGIPGDVILLHQGEPVGVYLGEMLAIDPNHQRKDLSVPLILEGVQHRPKPTDRKMTPAGKSALTKAWRVANGQIVNPWP